MLLNRPDRGRAALFAPAAVGGDQWSRPTPLSPTVLCDETRAVRRAAIGREEKGGRSNTHLWRENGGQDNELTSAFPLRLPPGVLRGRASRRPPAASKYSTEPTTEKNNINHITSTCSLNNDVSQPVILSTCAARRFYLTCWLNGFCFKPVS